MRVSSTSLDRVPNLDEAIITEVTCLKNLDHGEGILYLSTGAV